VEVAEPATSISKGDVRMNTLFIIVIVGIFAVYVLAEATDLFGCHHELKELTHIESPFTNYTLKLEGDSRSFVRHIRTYKCMKCGADIKREEVKRA